MKKKFKKVTKITLIVFFAIFLIYSLFVLVDYTRLKNSKRGTKPLICIKEEAGEYSQQYWGLGYSVKYYAVVEEEQRDGITYSCIYGNGAEYRVFGILMWNYCE